MPGPQQRGCGIRNWTSWTPKEDNYIVGAVNSIGKKWYVIAKELCGRTGAAIKAQWDSICEDETQLAGGGNP